MRSRKSAGFLPTGRIKKDPRLVTSGAPNFLQAETPEWSAADWTPHLSEGVTQWNTHERWQAVWESGASSDLT